MDLYAATLLTVFLATMLASQGGRDQLLVASLSHRLGTGPGLVLASVLAVCVSTAAWGWLGVQASAAIGEDNRSTLVGIAIIVAAILLVARSRLTLPKEPTRSIGAITLVLIMRQIFDAPRLLTFATFAWLGSSWGLSAAAALGSLFALAQAMVMGSRLHQWPHWRRLRTILAITLLGAMLASFLVR